MATFIPQGFGENNTFTWNEPPNVSQRPCRGGYQPPVRYTVQNGTDFGELVRISNILPFIQPLKRHNMAGG